ncbi:MAG: glycosyltransferase [Lachnospiraceae bacterium]|nr:glycosyltransferase [Lachnospiraceae bacterium]
MNEYKFQFVICSNNEDFLAECITYISLLEVPEGYSVDVISILEAASMTAGYNEGMRASDAKYKIYLHQDVFIVYRKFLYALLEIFESDPQIGMIGMVGSPKLPSCGIMWYGAREGGGYGLIPVQKPYEEYEYSLEDGLHEVEAIDGFIMITCQDLPWREDLFDGWDFYDISQSFEFRKQGYKVVVPEQISPWCKHDDGFINLACYDKYRKLFLNEYYGSNAETAEPIKEEVHDVSDNLESIMVYVVVYHENAAAGELALAEKIREEFDREGNAVYFIGIGEEDTYEECIENFYAFHPDVVITVNFAGFTLAKENGELLYNALYCDCIHVLANTPWRYGYFLTKRMNFTSTVVVPDFASRDYIEKYCENVPKVLCKRELKEFMDAEGLEEIKRRLDKQPKVYKKISEELLIQYHKNQGAFEKLLREYLEEQKMLVNEDEFVDLLIQMKDVAEYIQTAEGKKKKPLVSVVIPTYNREKVLKRAMESVLSQSYTNLELIIADDCSDDNTEQLVKSMMEEDGRIRYIRGERNLGPSGARNLGASVAKGDYIAFNDSDAIWKAGKLEKQLAFFEKHTDKEIGLVFHAYLLSGKDGTEACHPFEEIPEGFRNETMMVHLLDEPLADTSAMMIPIKVWKAIGGFNEELWSLEDYDLSLRIAEGYEVCYFHDPLITTYYSEASVSQNWKEGIKAYFYILEKYAYRYKDYEMLKWKRIFQMWDSCKKLGYEEFFKELFFTYVHAAGEDVNEIGHQMQHFIEKYTFIDEKWDIWT